MTRTRAALLLAATVVLFAVWSLVVPIYETPDEPAHWQYARHLREHWTLPLYTPEFYEANSPPLGYVLFAPFAVSDASPDGLLSRRANGDLVSLAEPRRFLNTGEAYRQFWPQRLARLAAAAISTLTVFFSWRAGVAAGGSTVGLLTALIVALLPMFTFRAGGISNDVALGCFSAAATWGMVRLVREPFSWRVAWWTSAAIGLAYLSKINAIALLPPFILALLAAGPAPTWRVRAWRLGALALAAAIVAPWSIRNVVLYGDPFASEAMRHAIAFLLTERSLWSAYFVTVFPHWLGKSFIGVFGWAAVTMPRIAYWAYLVLIALGFGGASLSVIRRRTDWRVAAVLSLVCLAALAVVVRINLQYTQPQGRYLVTCLPAFAILVALGLRAVPPPFARLTSPAVVGVALLAGNLYALLGVVLPAYHPAPVRTLASGERVMVPSALQDMVVADGDSRWVVTGAAPGWLAHVEVRAEAFAAFEVELTATTIPAAQRACVVYASTDRPIPANPPVCVDWLADGRPRTVRIPVRGQRGWDQQVSHIRLDPFAAGAVPAGTAVSTRRPRLIPATTAAARSGDRP
jgi:hypothetical protein